MADTTENREKESETRPKDNGIVPEDNEAVPEDNEAVPDHETEPEEDFPDPVLEYSLLDNPIEQLNLQELNICIRRFYSKHFQNQGSATFEELWMGARLARNYDLHIPPPESERESGERSRQSISPSTFSDSALLAMREWRAIQIQQSLAFWNEPKDLLLTLAVCFMASFTQGWDQAANADLGWPSAFGLVINNDGTGRDMWKVLAIDAVPWFSAAVLGPYLVNPLFHSRFFGRRGIIFCATCLSFGSMAGGSQAQSWHGYLVSRIFLGIGIGVEAIIVPIWESETVPPAKRGRFLVLSQICTALGIAAGSIATYIFRNSWRIQVISGALPALILLILLFSSCESPRWLIMQDKYLKAFDTLIKLRKERILAAEELIYIHFQIQGERTVIRKQPIDFNMHQPPTRLGHILGKFFTLSRNRNAAIASMIVMLAQQLSGITIIVWLGNVFFNTGAIRAQPTDPNTFNVAGQANTRDSLRLVTGFSVASAFFSVIAFFLVEPLPEQSPLAWLDTDSGDANSQIFRKFKRWGWLFGRRSLMLLSLAGGTTVLLILTFVINVSQENAAKMPVMVVLIIVYAFFHSPGMGCVPFLYSSEIWLNDGRELGMSWAVFWNFTCAGLITLFIPQGFHWGHSKVFGIFTGLSFLSFIMVFLFVPTTDHAVTIEEVNAKFKRPLTYHAKGKVLKLFRKATKPIS